MATVNGRGWFGSAGKTRDSPPTRSFAPACLTSLLIGFVVIFLSVPLAATAPPTGELALVVRQETLTVAPQSGPAGTVVTVSGTGWDCCTGTSGDIHLIDEAGNPIDIGDTQVDEVGNLSGDAVIPDVPPNAYTLLVCSGDPIEPNGACSEEFFEVTLDTVAGLAPDAGIPGTVIDVLGEGWCCQERDQDGFVYLITEDGSRTPIGNTTAFSDQTLTGSATIPLESFPGTPGVDVCSGPGGEFETCFPTTFEILPPDARVEPAVQDRGGAVVVGGEGWCCEVAHVQGLGADESVPLDENGAFLLPLGVPPDAPEGDSEVVVCNTGGSEFCLPLVVVVPPVETTSTTITPTTTTTTPTSTTSTTSIPATTTPPTVPTTTPRPETTPPVTTVVEGSNDGGSSLVPFAAGAGIILLLIGLASILFAQRNGRGPEPGPKPPPPPPPATGPVLPVLRVPAELVAGQPVEARLDLEVDGEPYHPGEPLGLDVQFAADGYELPQGLPRTLTASRQTTPSVSVPLVPDEVADPQPRRLVAYVFRSGHLVGWAQATPVVVPADVEAEAGMAPSAAVPLGDTDGLPPDLTLTITRGTDDKRLVWGFDSPHPVSVPGRQVVTTLPKENARAFAHDEVFAIAETPPDFLQFRMEGIAREVGDEIPVEAWELLKAVWPYAANQDRAPALLLVSEEPYVPWELAYLREDIPISVDGLRILGAQTTIGRWMPPDAKSGPRPRYPILPPPSRIEIDGIVAVSGDQVTTGVPPLPYATKEAAFLRDTFGATVIRPTVAEVSSLLANQLEPGGNPVAADIVHFACHGLVDPNRPSRSGLVMFEGPGQWHPLTATILLGAPLIPERRPLLFLNACQTGTPQEGLDAFGGLVGASLRSGARGFLAPLWAVDDKDGLDIASTLYELGLVSSVPLGEVLRRLRSRAPDPGGYRHSYLAYAWYGHPLLTVRRSDPE